MNHAQLQEEIISSFRSEDLKRVIAERHHVFSGEELLSIAYHYAPSFDERLRQMQLIADYAPSASEHARRCIAWQKGLLDEFVRADENQIYELHIRETPDSYDERYLCASYETTLEMIDCFYREYEDGAESPQAEYTIAKRMILQPGQAFCEDELVSAHFAAGKVLTHIYGSAEGFENGPCGQHCNQCANPCAANTPLLFPTFLPDRAPVRYRSFSGAIEFGIFLDYEKEDLRDSYYIIPLDSEMLCRKNYDEAWGFHPHEHIPCPDVEKVSIDDLDAELRENYAAFIAWLNARENR